VTGSNYKVIANQNKKLLFNTNKIFNNALKDIRIKNSLEVMKLDFAT
jgi:hypothetical protein